MKSNQGYFTFLMMIVSVLLASMAARAQSPIEVTCRAKAKEAALQIYQGCMTDSRAAQIQSLREGYRSELATVKAKYEGMLKELKVKDTKQVSQQKAIQAPARIGQPETPVKGVAKTLPPKRFDNGPALPVQSSTEDLTAVATPPVEMAGVNDPDLAELEDGSGF